ncbi:MAG: LacI family DNA-binding transcriptional regulator [Sideroxyarcus sp.]|nr:LacI family DNA-binding transcriptional regulator [Sideroxyarcus sp.]
MSTIQDVARLAGVSVSTVSNVLNGRESRMRPDTLAKVQGAISELSFRPNQSARVLKTGHLPMLVLMVPNIANPFFGSLAQAVESAALQRGYGLLLCNTYRDAKRERSYAESFLAQGVRGVILGSALQEHEHLVPLVERGLAIVSLDRVSTTDGLLRDFVSVDNHLAGFMAAEHLIKLHHRKITYISAPLTSMNRLARLKGARDACAAHAVSLEEVVGAAPSSGHEVAMIEMGKNCVSDLIKANCQSTAYIGFNDMLTIGIIAGLRQHGKRVPDELSVIGIDGLALGEFVGSPMTTIGQPLQDIANTSVDFVLSRIMAPHLAGRERIFVPELIVRESTSICLRDGAA